MNKPGGNVPPADLDTRLLRFRTRPGSEAATRLAGDLLAADRAKEAVEVVTAALAATPGDATLLVLDGRAQAAAGDLLKAQASLLQAARAAPSQKEPFRWLGEILLQRGDPERAVKVLERARAIDPSDRIVQTLHARAERLAQVAATDGQAAADASRAAFERKGGEGQEERTVVRPELSEELARSARPTVDGHRPTIDERARSTIEDHPALGAEDEDIPTSTMDKEMVVAALSGKGAAARPAPDPLQSRARSSPAPPMPSPRGAPARIPAPPVEAAPRLAAAEPAAPAPALDAPLDAGPEPWTAPPESDAPPEPAPDVEVGGQAGQPEDVDRVLALLAEQRIFEPAGGEPAAWAPTKESRSEGTRVGTWVASAWVALAVLFAVGWFGWREVVRQRREEAAGLVAQAGREARVGDHERLVDAERHLREARALDPQDVRNTDVLLFVQIEQALEDGSFEIGYLRPTIARAERVHAEPAMLHAAHAVLAAGEGDLGGARSAIDHALEGEGEHRADILYVAGRIEQRLGAEHALERLEAAVHADPELATPAVALAEARADEGRAEDAMALLQGVLSRQSTHLRALLWKAFLGADDCEPDAGMAELTALEPRLEHGAPTDHVLVALTRARLLRRRGEAEPAGEAVEAAMAAGATEPRLLALMARAARGAGRLLEAEYAANAAVRGSPSNVDFRKLLAAIYLDRRNGQRALSTLAQLPADDPDVLEMTGRAALLVGSAEAVSGAAAAIDQYVEAHEDASLELRSLRIRLGLEIAEDPAPFLAQARTLARDNPGDPIASLALGEAALRARDAETAVRALSQVTTASPDDAEAHQLLGRARRMQGDAIGARESFARALELQPDHAEARIALGLLLLDMGEYAAADTLYTELSQAGGSTAGISLSAAGKIGRVEALVGLGHLDDASVQLEGVRDAARTGVSARLAAAHLALARGRSGEALRELRPLVPAPGTEAPAPSALVLATFGEALAATGEVDPALAQYDAALTSDSGLPEALIGRAEVLLGADRARDAEPLVAQARQALETRIRPPSLRARLLVVEALVAGASHDAERARTLLREASELPGAPAAAFFQLGEALTGTDAEGARAAYTHYLELAPTGPFAGRARRALR